MYGVRFAVPKRLQSALQRGKIVISLGTRDLAVALPRFKAEEARVLELFASAERAIASTPPRLTPVELGALQRQMIEMLVMGLQAQVIPAVEGGLPWGHPLADLSPAMPATTDLASRSLLVLAQYRQAVTDGEDALQRWRTAQLIAAQSLCGRVWHPADSDAVAQCHHQAEVMALRIAGHRAVDWRRYLEGQAAVAELPDPGVVLQTEAPVVGLPVVELTERWVEARKPAPKTAITARTAARRVAAMELVDAAAITAADGRRWRDARLDVVARTTVARDLGLLRAIWAWAVDEELVPANPWRDVMLSRSSDGAAGLSRQGFSNEQVELLLQQAAQLHRADERWMFPVVLMAGLRIEEFCCLRREDLIHTEHTWCLRADPAAQLSGRLKTGASERLVPMHDQLLALGFDRWISTRPPGYLFEASVVPKGDPRRSHSLSIRAGTLIRRWGITNRRLTAAHSCRHTFCARLSQAGVEDRAIKTLAGHSTAGDVTSRYAGPYPLTQLRGFVNRVQWPIS